GAISYPIPVVIILCLSFSLVEALLILPSHLAHMKPETESRFAILRWLAVKRQWIANRLDVFATGTYQPTLRKLLHFKGTTIIGFTIAFALSVVLFTAGWIKISFFPQVPGDSVE